jgi:ABC-type transport system involved in multi-copper enzyme maturation permease subunit
LVSKGVNPMSGFSPGASRTKTPRSKLLGLAFAAGFLAVPLFHQPMLALLGAIGVTLAGPYVTHPIPPFGVPRILSQAFWGGIWGIVFALVAPRFPRGIGYWISAVLFGALALSLVAWFIVAPLKGLPVAGGGRPAAITTALLVNGAWGFGTALLLLAFRKVVGGGRIT